MTCGTEEEEQFSEEEREVAGEYLGLDRPYIPGVDECIPAELMFLLGKSHVHEAQELIPESASYEGYEQDLSRTMLTEKSVSTVEQEQWFESSFIGRQVSRVQEAGVYNLEFVEERDTREALVAEELMNDAAEREQRELERKAEREAEEYNKKQARQLAVSRLQRGE